MTMSICNDAFKTKEISTICCHLIAPEGPTGSPQTPPGYFRTLQKPREMTSFQETCEKTKKHYKKHDHVNLQWCL